jgi:hypothetical protein
MLYDLLLLVLLSFQPFKGDTETFEARTQRMSVVAHAIENAANKATCYEQPEGCKRIWSGSRKELAFALATLMKYESDGAQRIHEGKCRPHECDSVRVYDPKSNAWVPMARSLSLWQLKKFDDIPDEDWAVIPSVEGTDVAAWHAARRLAGHRNRCGGTLAGAMGGYATGGSCSWPGAPARAAYVAQLMNTPEEQLKRRADRWRALQNR